MMVWLLTVYLVLNGNNQVWLEKTFPTETECRRWLDFYQEYPFKPTCKQISIKDAK